VSSAHTTGNTTSLTLQITPSKMSEIPSNVQARILPKTLFGEKFVDLVPPTNPSTVSFASLESQHKNIVIHQDDSKVGIELQTVFTNLVPVLRTLNPAKLSMTLNAIATALENRGEELGQNIALTNQYFSVFNQDLPTFEHDISGLADLASNYADATPHLLDILRNTVVTARTFATKADTYSQFLAGTAGFATEASKVFGENSSRLIGLSRVSRPVLDLYSNYSINLECLANGLAIYDRTRLETVFNQGPFLHITLTPVNDRGQYTAAERPTEADFKKIPPNCYGLPYGDHGLHPQAPRYPGPVSDNYNEGGLAGSASLSTSAPSGTTAGVGSSAEQKQIHKLLTLIDPKSVKAHGFSSGLTDELLGPLLRGMAIGVSK
jgi:virulence factor Mce-like protein